MTLKRNTQIKRIEFGEYGEVRAIEFFSETPADEALAIITGLNGHYDHSALMTSIEKALTSNSAELQ